MQEDADHALSGFAEKGKRSGDELLPLFETNDIQEAKEFAMRLAFEEFNLVKVMDTKRQELVRDFDAAVYREQ